jgi:hypothetical protein
MDEPSQDVVAVEQPEDVLGATSSAPPWPHENRSFAAV